MNTFYKLSKGPGKMSYCRAERSSSPQTSSRVFREDYLPTGFSCLQPRGWNGRQRLRTCGCAQACAAREAGGARGGAEAVWAVLRIARYPPAAPALASRLLPPPALLMLLLADMDVVNQVRVPAPRTEPAAAQPPRPGRSGPADS